MSFEKCRELLSTVRSNINTKNNDKASLAIGPCAIENKNGLEEIATIAKLCNATHLRGGAFKLRTNTSSFHGLGIKAWEIIKEIGNKHNLLTVSEVTSISQVSEAKNYLDILQIGARSMWNFELLFECAKSGKPILLKRGLGATTFEWLATATRLITYGCKEIILCERGINSTDQCPRYAVDLSVLVFLINESPFPIWLDVSHPAGDAKVALELLKTSLNIGLNGVMAEVHTCPAEALCDSNQAIDILDFKKHFQHQIYRNLTAPI